MYIYIEKVLIPTLRQGDIVIMDNVGSHKAKALRHAIRAAGAHLFFLPKYSPDLNPIEQFFAKLKHWLRKAARRAPRSHRSEAAAPLAPQARELPGQYAPLPAQSLWAPSPMLIAAMTAAAS